MKVASLHVNHLGILIFYFTHSDQRRPSLLAEALSVTGGVMLDPATEAGEQPDQSAVHDYMEAAAQKNKSLHQVQLITKSMDIL